MSRHEGRGNVYERDPDPSETPSVYSVDSFVEDFSDRGGGDDDDQHDGGEAAGHASYFVSRQPSYISPASSASFMSENSEALARREHDVVHQDRMGSGIFDHHRASTPPPPPPPPGLPPTKPPPVSSSQESGGGEPLKPRHRKMSSESIINIKPAHPFFAAGFYDTEGDALSDGSLVFLDMQQQQQQQQSSQQQQQQKQRSSSQQVTSSASLASQRQQQPQHAGQGGHKHAPTRERFSSHDSAGSSGSIHYVPAKPPPSHPSQQQQQPVPQILPYHERRKLLQQRQQQQQQQQQQQNQVHESQRLQPQSQYPPVHMPFHPQAPYYPEVQGYYPGIPPQGVAVSPYHPSMQQPNVPFAYPFMMPPQYPPYPLHGHSPTNYGSQQPIANAPQSGQPSTMRYGRAEALNQRPPLRGPYTPPMVTPQHQLHQDREPSQLVHASEPISTLYSQAQLPRYQPSSMSSSSLDSTGANAKVRNRGQRAREETPPPPPPPPSGPPPPLNAAHMRKDSSGSVSSLGSMDRSMSREYKPERTEGEAGSRPAGGGIFQRLNPWGMSASSGSHVAQTASAATDNYGLRADIGNRAVPYSYGESASQHVFAKGSVQNKASSRRTKVSLGPPPTNRDSHRRLPSIDNDQWSEGGYSEVDDAIRRRRRRRRSKGINVQVTSRHPNHHDASSNSEYEAESEPNASDEGSGPNEQSSLLPPSGISSNELDGYGSRIPHQVPAASRSSILGYSQSSSRAETLRMDNTATTRQASAQERENERRKHKRKKKRARGRASRRSRHSEVSLSSSSASSHNYRQWLDQNAVALENKRTKPIQQWRTEEELARVDSDSNSWYLWISHSLSTEGRVLLESITSAIAWTEEFFANLPLTIGAIALATATLGVDWFKFAEENLSTCEPVHFHSSQCTFPEFPGCFYCDTSPTAYQVALRFHWTCSAIAGLLALTFLTKLVVARRIAFDELSSPTTATPAGLICMTLDVVFAGRGFAGMCVVMLSSGIHLCLAVWFIYMALAYHMMPEPSWFPNTVGIGISAVKTWLYFPAAGHFLMAVSLCLNLFFFPVSLIRVAMNRKISAPVCWMQMSAPNISLYALTIMAQPSFPEEHPDVTDFQKVHRMVYLPIMHFLFGLCLIGMIASVASLLMRWEEFRRLPFSPAHAAFCCPTLSHANAVQAYRAAVNSFSRLPVVHPFRSFLYGYWVFVLVAGTVVTISIAARFMHSLPKWTHISLEGEVEPPAPYETTMSLSNAIVAGDTMIQPFVSPAVLQANETGALYLARSATGRHVYVRTRKVTALGFEPIMDAISLDREREFLLDHVAMHPPRRRTRTLSVPGIDFNYDENVRSQAGFGSPESLPLPGRSASHRLHKGTRRY